MGSKIRILVNAIPLINIKTGIGRYLEGLYEVLETISNFEIAYFDGFYIHRRMPKLSSTKNWQRKVSIFWHLPTTFSLSIRLVLHFLREIRFVYFQRKFHLYHEAAFFPFRSHLPVVFTFHDLSLIKYPQWHPRERVLYFKIFHKRIFKTEHLLTVSHFIKNEIIQELGINSNKITVTYPGYNKTLFFPRTKKEINTLKQKYRLPKKYYLFIGTGDPRKNFNLMKKASSYFKYPLVVAGWSGWDTLKAENKNIIFLGYLPDKELPILYSGAKCLIFPSLYEGFGLPIIEAMACGCPVIVSQKGSLPEVAGEAALYLKDPFNEKSLLEALCKLEEKQELLKKAGIIRARNFSWENTAALTSKVFKEVLN